MGLTEPAKFFKDTGGIEWTPRFRALDMVELCHECGVKLSDLVSMTINPGHLIIALWYACRWQAKDRNVTREMFLENLGVVETKVALLCLLDSLKGMFPEPKKDAGQQGETPVPLNPGS